MGTNGGAEKKKVGRPSQYNEAVVKKILMGLRAGVNLSTAARFAGVSPAVALKWYERKKDFVVRCEQARAEKQVKAGLRELEAIEAGDVRAVQTYLTREEQKRQNRSNMRFRRAELKAASEVPGVEGVEVKTPSAFISALMMELKGGEAVDE